MDASKTHVSTSSMGTISYQPPELLLGQGVCCTLADADWHTSGGTLSCVGHAQALLTTSAAGDSSCSSAVSDLQACRRLVTSTHSG
jgi:hypothetical protein